MGHSVEYQSYPAPRHRISSLAALEGKAATRQPNFASPRLNVCFSQKRTFKTLEILDSDRPLTAKTGQSGCVFGQEKVICKHLSSVERHAVTGSQSSRRLNNGVHTYTGEQTGIANLNSVVSNERAEDFGVPG